MTSRNITIINFSQPLLKAEKPECCSFGLSIPINIENLIPFENYRLDYSSIGPGVAVFTNSTIDFKANQSTQTVDNIVYLENATNFIIKATISKIEDTNAIVLSEDILGVDCGSYPPPKPTPTITATPTKTVTPTPSLTPTNTPTCSITPSVTATPTLTPSKTAAVTPTPSITPTVSITASSSPTPTLTSSPTPTITNTPSITPSIGLPKITLQLGASTGCGSEELVVYANVQKLLPNTLYKYSFGVPSDFDSVPSTGQFRTTSDTTALIKTYLVYNRKLSPNEICHINNYGISLSLYYEDNQLVGSGVVNLACDSSDCSCPKFTIAGFNTPFVTPTPTRAAISIPGLDDINKYPKFICPIILTKQKVPNQIFIIDTLTDFAYNLNIVYSFYGSPEKVVFYNIYGNELYNSGFVGSTDKDDNGAFLFCPSIDRRAHTQGTYDAVTITKPAGSRYVVGVLDGACGDSTEWKISVISEVISTPTPTPTSSGVNCLCPSTTPPPTPTPTPDLGCSYRFNNFVDNDRRKTKKVSVMCSDIIDKDMTSFVSIDKPISATVLSNNIIISGSSVCIGAQYTNPTNKISLTRIKDKNMDSSFGAMGVVTHAVKNEFGSTVSVSTKKIIPQGNRFLVISQSNNEVIISRHLSSNGFIDTSFGIRGFVSISNINEFKVLGIGDSILVNNQLILFLETYDSINQKYAVTVASYNSGSGRLNASFGSSSGATHIDYALGSSQYKIKTGSYINDKILVISQNKDAIGSNVVCVSRLDSTGTPDSSFYNNGILKLISSDLKVDSTTPTEPVLSNCLFTDSGMYLSVVYSQSANIGVIKYKYSGGKESAWKAVLPNNDAESISIGTDYDASIYDPTTNEWYIGYNIQDTIYTIDPNAPLTSIVRKGHVNIKTISSKIRESDLPADYTLDPPSIPGESLYDINNAYAGYIQKSYRCVVVKHSLQSSSAQIQGPTESNQLSKQLIQSNIVSSLVLFNNDLYIIGFGGDEHNYSFLVTKWLKNSSNQYATVDDTFGEKGYLAIDFDSLCVDDNIQPPPEGDPCALPTPTPTIASGSNIIFGTVQSSCINSNPTLTVNWSAQSVTNRNIQYIARLVSKDNNSTLSAVDGSISAGSLIGSINIDLKNVAITNNSKICQIDLLDSDNNLSTIASKTIVLSIPVCG